MKSFYERAGETATRLLTKYGQKAIWVINTPGVPADPQKPWIKGAMTSVEKEVMMAFPPDDRDMRETKNFSRRSSVARGNLQGYLGPVDFVPSLSDTVRRLNPTVEYAIETITQIRPSDEGAVLYELRLK